MITLAEKLILKPCKKCGYIHSRIIRYGGFLSTTKSYRISCPGCGYCTKEKNTKQEAIDVWNTPIHKNTNMNVRNKIMKIYMVELNDHDRNDSVGYFIDPQKANACRDYMNRTDPSNYYGDGYEWNVVEYTLDTKDYESLVKEIEEQERIEFETRMEREKQEELAKLEELKAKYETPKVAKWTLHSDGSGTCSHCHFTQRGVYDQDNFNRFCSVCGYEMTI